MGLSAFDIVRLAEEDDQRIGRVKGMLLRVISLEGARCHDGHGRPSVGASRRTSLGSRKSEISSWR